MGSAQMNLRKFPTEELIEELETRMIMNYINMLDENPESAADSSVQIQT